MFVTEEDPCGCRVLRRDRGEESNTVSRAPLCNLMGWNTGEGRDLKAAAEKAKKP